MKKIFGFFKRRWVISLLGLIALALFIWFLGPLFAFDGAAPLEFESTRWITIAAISALWLLSQIWSFFRARQKNQQIMQGMVATEAPMLSPDEQASADELHTLGERLQEALGVLKKTRLGGRSGKQFLYQLPWYVLIGPPGSGKTTLLGNSDLKFPLSEQFGKDALRGVGGTRNCDWWFTEEAVLLDTAGRYTTQDSQQTVDSSAWLGFLGLLKKHRRRRPINGVMIAVSISELLESSPAQRHQHAEAIRQRIQELYETLSVRIPIYLFFTKCDLLAGFAEYFDELSREDRNQVWGMTFPLDDDPKAQSIEHLATEFELLEDRLQGRLIDKLERQRNTERRDLIYTFPQQFSTLKPVISEFAEEIFQSSRYQQPVMLRGVYFTSATQEGSPIDRVMGSLMGNFGLDRQALSGTSGQGKSYFINRLLGKVIFAESGLAGSNQKLERQKTWMQRGTVLATGVALVLATLALSISYFRNQGYIEETAGQAEQLQTAADQLDARNASLRATLPLLDLARNLPGGYAEQQQSGFWSLHLGLDQRDKLGDASQSIYKKLLNQTFLPRLMTRLEQQIQENGNNPDYLYEALKVYLMLGDRAGHFDSESIQAWMTLDWDNQLPLDVTNDQRRALVDHLAVLVETQPRQLPRPLDPGIVEQARRILARVPLAERVYGRLKLELGQTEIAEFRISDAAGRDAPLVFTRKSGDALNQGLPGLFTYAGYYQAFLPESKDLTQRLAAESWIFGERHQIKPSGAALRSLRDDVHTLYLNEYIRQWQTLLADLRIVPFRNLEEAVQILNVLSGNPSPLRLLLEAVEKETTLDRVAEKKQDLIDKAGKKISAAKSRLSAIARKAPDLPKPRQRDLGIGPNRVAEKFQALNALVQSKDERPAAIDNLLTQLNELYVFLSPLVNAGGEEMVLEQRKQIAAKLQRLKAEAPRQPYPVKALLADTTAALTDLVGGGVCTHLSAVWRSEVLSSCRQTISNRYPISRNADLEITQEDFGLFFGPGGRMDAFFNKYLAGSVDKTTTRWRWISKDGSPVCMSSASLTQFKRAEKIRNTFFRTGGPLPTIGFSLKPRSMSPDITRLSLNIDGQKLGYAHEQPQITPIKWPGPDNSGQVSLSLLPPLLGSESGITAEGPWGIFRLFDRASIQPISGSGKFQLTFNLQGRAVSFELRPNSAVNPFQSDELQHFRCPQNL